MIGRERALRRHSDDGCGQPRDVLVWEFPQTVRLIASSVLGGGLRTGRWVLNAEVALAYARLDPAKHIGEIAEELGLAEGEGCGLLTAARVAAVTGAEENSVWCDATVGLSHPVWAAAPEGGPNGAGAGPGTINLVCGLPVPLSDAALVNAVLTATEAKTQALLEAGVEATGTASDAIVVVCPLAEDGATEPFCGPRSPWGARLARVVHRAVSAGTADYLRRA